MCTQTLNSKKNQMDASTDFDFETEVPDEILCQLFSYMKDEYWVWYNVCLVCRRWNHLCHVAVYNIGGCDGRALNYYAGKGDAEAVKRLFDEHGVDPLASGSTPIAEAFTNRHHEILDMFLRHPRIVQGWASIPTLVPLKDRIRCLVQIMNEMTPIQDETSYQHNASGRVEEFAPVPPDSNEESTRLVFDFNLQSEYDIYRVTVGSGMSVDTMLVRPNDISLHRVVRGVDQSLSGLQGREDPTFSLWADSIKRLKKQRIGNGKGIVNSDLWSNDLW